MKNSTVKNQVVRSGASPAPTQVVLEHRERSWWNSLTDTQRQIIAWTAIVLGVSIVTIISIKLASNKVRKVVKDRKETESFGEDRHATWAKKLKMAFDNDGWWGTDEESIRRVMREIPSKEDFAKVQVSYKKLYKGENLVETLTDELKATEYEEMLAILQSKPEKAKEARKDGAIYDPNGWAIRLYNAMSIYYMGFIPGTDEDAITAVFLEMPTQEAFKQTAQVYKAKYGAKLETDLDGDLDWTMDWRAIIRKSH